MNQTRVAIIGTGNMGKHHARIYASLDSADLVAICDRNEAMGGDLSSKFGCSYYPDYNELFEAGGIDAVSVAAPTPMHYEIALRALENGLHVLIEKPITTTMDQGREIVDLAREKSLILMVGHIERFNPAVNRLKGLIQSGRLGKIISIIIRRVGGLPPQIKDFNVMMDLGIHDIDISNYLMGESPKKVYGLKSRNVIGDQEDSAVVLMEYANALSFIEVNWVTPVKIRTLNITGTKAFGRLDYIQQTLTLYENPHISEINDAYSNFEDYISKFNDTDEIRVGLTKEEPLRLELSNFLQSVKGEAKPFVSGEAALSALEIALSI